MATKTFKEAYGVLQHHAETLREQQEPNIDDLLSIVTESVGAYKICKERIDAVEKALEKALSDAGAPAREIPRAQRPSAAQLLDLDEEGDIPF
jgi:exodeoxyribonuclease VII small subunit